MARGQSVATLAAVVLVAVLFTAPAEVTGNYNKQPLRFNRRYVRYYAQLQGGAPGLAPGFLPAVNPNVSANFGAGTLFAFNLTAGIPRTSKQIGFVRGYTVETSYLGGLDSRLLEVAFIEWNDGRFVGTLQLQGMVRITGTEIAVTGGTGSFRGARGYLIVTLVKNDEPPFLTFAHDLFLL